MITEDYCSFEVSKLLKEKGFDERCNSYFISDNEIALILNRRDFNNHGIYLSAPTCQMAAAYVRKTYNIFIRIGYNRYYKEYSYDIFSMDIDNELAVSGYNFKTHKDAVNAALIEIFKHLI